MQVSCLSEKLNWHLHFPFQSNFSLKSSPAHRKKARFPQMGTGFSCQLFRSKTGTANTRELDRGHIHVYIRHLITINIRNAIQIYFYRFFCLFFAICMQDLRFKMIESPDLLLGETRNMMPRYTSCNHFCVDLDACSGSCWKIYMQGKGNPIHTHIHVFVYVCIYVITNHFYFYM